MGHYLHMTMSIRGALRNGSWKRDLVGACTANDGHTMTADEIFDELCDHLALGHKLIRVGSCPNFDPREGCLCHEVATGGIS